MRATRAIIHLDRFRRNLLAVRERIGPSRRICVPVKADAYGHGALSISRTALDAGASHLASATVSEALELREAGITAPILLLSQPLPEEIPLILRHRLEVFVSDGEFAGELAAAAAEASLRLPVHLKIDTGMGRLGCSPEAAPDLARLIHGHPSLDLQGTATHLAVSDSAGPEDIGFTGEQLGRFRQAVERIRAAGLNPGLLHAANSGGVLLHEASWLDMVRPGILLYGYNLSGTPFPVEPVMELSTRIVFLRTLRKGESVSYGRTWTAPRDTVIATIPVGYADGLPRILGGAGWQVSVRGRPYPLAGRICMDQCMIDLGPGSGIGRWEEVTVFGGPGQDAGALAARIGTIPYEITCNINKRVPRVYR
jgi:alanine racemase